MNINTQVERQINEQSCFSPIEWLIDNGRLTYKDYEQWRKEEVPFLDDCLQGDVKKIVLQLNEAAKHATSLGMKKVEINFTSWLQNTSRHIKASHSLALNEVLASKYIRVVDTPQLDLFFDNPILHIENSLRDALSSRQTEESQKLLNKLSEQDPNHSLLHQFENLMAYLCHMDTDIESSSQLTQIAEELEGLETIIEPLAKECLLAQSRDYLIPAWRRIAFALEGVLFNSNTPKLHASYAWQRTLDWSEVRKSIEREKDFTLSYDLCGTLSLATFFMGNREQHISLWCRLFWLDENRAEQDIEFQPDNILTTYWHTFLDQDDEMEPTWFPPWLLIAESGLAHHLSIDDDKDSDATPSKQAFNILLELQTLVQNGASEIPLRKKLNDINPTLLNLYQKKRST